MLSAPPTEAPPGTRPVLPAMRLLLGVFTVLTALAVVALFVLAEQTDRTFAWTIQPPLTAAFLGAGYAAGFVLVVLSLRERHWAHVRVPVLTVFVFVLLTLAASLLHLEKFHLDPDDAGTVAVAAGWFWLTVYVVLPVGMLAALWQQERAPGSDPPRRAPIPRLLSGALAVEAVVLTAVGTALYVAPASATALWPWPLTPLTARVVAAWLIAFGLATALAATAGDLRRLRTATIAYTVFGVAVAAAVARFAGTVAWGEPSAWGFAAMTVAVLLTGAAGWWLAPRDEVGR
ncbi:hypothetical protein [Blastococcus sp. URHD0036]|uniref:hypothetical protein n=1 Tax=Blastococcus sp. URHD0036 TaxID=1380356 RepID=UPI0012DF81CE|nr:hypothetical protein [Blastococcus sp. URHD0036]